MIVRRDIGFGNLRLIRGCGRSESKLPGVALPLLIVGRGVTFVDLGVIGYVRQRSDELRDHVLVGGTRAPVKRQNLDVSLVHVAIVIEILVAAPTDSITAEDRSQVGRVHDAVAVQITQANVCELVRRGRRDLSPCGGTGQDNSSKNC